MGFIYLIRNAVNGKGYVGQTVRSVRSRYNQHKASMRHGIDTALYRAMRKYGVENFTVQEVVHCDELLLNDLENYYIAFYGTFAPTGHGYNLTKGGNSNFSRTEEARLSMSKAHKGQVSPMAGKHHSAETKAKLKAAAENISAKTRAKMSLAKRGKAAPNRGKSPSEETKAKISAALKGRSQPPMTEETRAKIKAIQRNRSPETRTRISANKKAWWASHKAA